jgi:sulfide:quinone oxidoreductase
MARAHRPATLAYVTSAQSARRRDPKVLIAGGGVAALEAMLALRHFAAERVRIELVSPGREFVYRPLTTAEPFALGEALRFDLATIASDCRATYVPDAITSVDAEARVARARSGAKLAYDILVIACGARMREALPGAVTFWGTSWASPDQDAFSGLLDDIRAGIAREVVFALPVANAWPLPLYELALLISARAEDPRPSLTLVTPEPSPLALFGSRASAAIAELLEEREISVLARSHAARIEDGHLALVPAGRLAADRVVTLPALEGRRIRGVPHDAKGFIPVDDHGRVRGIESVYAAGDAAAFPIKQGGIAAQQADAAAEHIAARAGAPIEPRPFVPIMRGLLLTGGEPRFMRAEVSGGRGDTSAVAADPLWWPPAKISGRFLAPYLATGANQSLLPVGGPQLSTPSGRERAIPIEITVG